MKLRSSEPSTKVFRARLTARELAAWTLLARKRGKSLADVVRDGMAAVCLRECLCAPGMPLCLYCASRASRKQAEAVPAASESRPEPVRVHDRYCDQEADLLQLEAANANAARQRLTVSREQASDEPLPV